MKVLNLYSGIGGNRKLWQDVEVTAVEIREDIAAVYRHYFPEDKIIIGDAHEYLLNHYQEFDFIWSSPPCQTHSRMMKATRHKVRRYSDMSLYQEIIFLKNFFDGLWVVENVKPYYEPLIKSFIEIERHYFWSNFRISTNHKIKNVKNFIKTEDIQLFEKYLNIPVDWKIKTNGRDRTAQTLRNCVHPETGLHILNCALKKHSNRVQQSDLFSEALTQKEIIK